MCYYISTTNVHGVHRNNECSWYTLEKVRIFCNFRPYTKLQSISKSSTVAAPYNCVEMICEYEKTFTYRTLHVKFQGQYIVVLYSMQHFYIIMASVEISIIGNLRWASLGLVAICLVIKLVVYWRRPTTDRRRGRKKKKSTIIWGWLYELRSVQNTGTCYPGQGWFVRNLGWGR